MESEESFYTSSSTPIPRQENASVFARFIALVLDGIFSTFISIIVVQILASILSLIFTPSILTIISSLLQLFVGYFYYHFTMIPMNGQTLGKKILNIRVKRDDGEPITPRTIIAREMLGKSLSTLVIGIGFLMAIFDSENKKALHDRIAETRVVQC